MQIPKPDRPGAIPRHLDNIQALRAVAALMVVAVHLQLNEMRAPEGHVLSPWLFYGVSGVDLFFVISGFIMVYIAHRRFGAARHALAFILERAARIYPPAWLFTALALAGVFAAGTADKWLSGHNLLFSFLLLPQRQPPLLAVSWTLIHELYFYLVFAVFMLFGFRWLPLALALWAALVLAAQKTGLWHLNPWTLIAFHPLTFEFIGGCVVGLIVVYFPPRFGLWAVLAGIAWLLWSIISMDLPMNPDRFPFGWGRVAAFAPPAALVVYGMVALEETGQWRAPPWLTRVGDWSYSLYLSHLLVIATLAHAWVRLQRPGVADNLAFIGVSLLAVLTLAWLSYRFYERPLLRRAKRLIRRLIAPR